MPMQSLLKNALYRAGYVINRVPPAPPRPSAHLNPPSQSMRLRPT
jgi:hypothetical protein